MRHYIKRLRKHYSQYEPTITELKRKYEMAMKEKMLMRLERDRLLAKVEAFESDAALKAGRCTLKPEAHTPPLLSSTRAVVVTGITRRIPPKGFSLS